MSEELEVGEGTGAGGATNSPVSSAKPIESAPDQSQVLLNIQKELEMTRSELRGLQGRQDKETNEVQRFMGEVKKRMASGMSLEQAEKSITDEQQVNQDKALLRMIAKKVGVLDEPSSPAAGNGAPMTVDKASELSKYGLDANDADVAEAIRGKSDLELKLAVAEVALKRATKPAADVSASTSIKGSPAKSSDTPALIEKLSAYQKEPLKYRSEITKIKAELDERNWQ